MPNEPFWNPASSDLFNNANRAGYGLPSISTLASLQPGANPNETSSNFAVTDPRYRNTSGFGTGTYTPTMGQTPEDIALTTNLAAATGYTGNFGGGQFNSWWNPSMGPTTPLASALGSNPSFGSLSQLQNAFILNKGSGL